MTIESRVEVRRIYDAPAPDDGTRVLVDRLWPRGVSKARAQLDDWCKDIAPSTELRANLTHATGPQPIHQHPGAVVRHRSVVDPAHLHSAPISHATSQTNVDNAIAA